MGAISFVKSNKFKDYVAEAWHNDLPDAACEIISAGRVPTDAKLVLLQSEDHTPTCKEAKGENKYVFLIQPRFFSVCKVCLNIYAEI